MTWMIYGANGYTGELVARLAVAPWRAPGAGRPQRRGGRRAGHVARSGRDGGRPGGHQGLHAALEQVDAVAHCAGPFARTAQPMVDACLATRTHYVDVTGEPEVFEAVLARDDEAAAAGVTLLTGGGFDVVPTDCLAGVARSRAAGRHRVGDRVPGRGGMSRGTALTGLDIRPPGRCAGSTESWCGAAGRAVAEVQFPSGTRTVGAVTWGDVVTAYHSTGIGNITVLSSVPARPAGRRGHLLRLAPFRALAARRSAAGRRVRRRGCGPDQVGGRGRGTVADRAPAGAYDGPNAYDITADAVVRAAVRLAGQHRAARSETRRSHPGDRVRAPISSGARRRHRQPVKALSPLEVVGLCGLRPLLCQPQLQDRGGCAVVPTTLTCRGGRERVMRPGSGGRARPARRYAAVRYAAGS